MSRECETCCGAGRIERGEFGGDCAAIHGGPGRMPDPPGWQCCDDCGGTGRIQDEEDSDEAGDKTASEGASNG